MKSVNLLDYSLTNEGLFISYDNKGQSIELELDAFATSELFKTLGIIDGFDSDSNEPVILYEAQESHYDEYGTFYRATGTSWMYWCDFVKEYNLTEKEAEIIAAHHAKDQYYKSILQKVGLLENQLKSIA